MTAMSASAASTQPAPRAAPDRADGLYRRGERIVFRVTGEGLPADAELVYEVLHNGVDRVAGGKTRPGAAVEVEAGAPGVLWFSARHSSTRIEAAAAVDPYAIKPTLPPPPDFDEYWRDRLERLAAVPIAPVVRPMPPPSEESYQAWHAKWPIFGDTPRRTRDIEVVEVEAPIGEGLPVRGYCAWPRGAAAGSLPAVLFTHGAGIGDSDLQKTCAAAQHGFLAMDINANGLLNGQSPAYYKEEGEKIRLSADRGFKGGRLDKRTLYIAAMYLRHRRALDVLCARPEWNGRDLMVRGASQGGALALACAGLDPRVSRICAGVPAFCDTAQPYSLKSWFLNADDDPDTIARVREAMRYVSLANFAPRCRASAYFTVAFLDRSCHPATVFAAYVLYGGPKRIFHGPAAGHGDIPNAIHYDAYAQFLMEPRGAAPSDAGGAR